MRKLTKKQFEKINDWININARPYDMAKWNYLYNGGSKEDILTEMVKYQNEDGGFGKGFEADILLPLSASIPTAEAIFQAYDFELDCKADWFKKVLTYFENTVQDIPKYWEDAPKEAMDYPHAPWWNYTFCTTFSPNPCGVVSSALILYGSDSQVKIGEKIASDCLNFLIGKDFCGDHDSYNIMKLIEKLSEVDCFLVTEEVVSAMKRRINENVCYGKSKWNEYFPQPLDFADSPDSMWFEDVKDGIEANINYWLDNINEQGVWTPNFSWGIDSEVSRRVTENWKGYIAVKRVRILDKYGLVER